MTTPIDFGIVWNDRDNAIKVMLKIDGVTLTQQEIEAITKVEIKYKDNYYNSIDDPTAFDLVTDKATGEISFSLGMLGLEVGSDSKAELIIYDVVNTNGIVWCQGKLKVKDDAAVV